MNKCEPKHWIITSSRHPEVGDFVSNWNLECPQNHTLFEPGTANLSGWALAANPHKQSALHVVLRFWNRTMSYPLHVHRSDVVEHFCGKIHSRDDLLCSGFYIPIQEEDALQGFEYGFEVDGIIRTIAKISLDFPVVASETNNS